MGDSAYAGKSLYEWIQDIGGSGSGEEPDFYEWLWTSKGFAGATNDTSLSLAIGRDSSVSKYADESIALGTDAGAAGSASVAAGYASTAYTWGVATGAYTEAGAYSVAVGTSAKAGWNSVSVGANISGFNSKSIIVGTNVSAAEELYAAIFGGDVYERFVDGGALIASPVTKTGTLRAWLRIAPTGDTSGVAGKQYKLEVGIHDTNTNAPIFTGSKTFFDLVDADATPDTTKDPLIL